MQTEPPKADPPKRKRRWFQFSLRTLLIFTTIVALGSGWFRARIAKARKQRAAIEAIEKSGGMVLYDYQVDLSGGLMPNAKPPVVSWPWTLFGRDCYLPVAEAVLRSDHEINYLDELNELRVLRLDGYVVADGGLSPATEIRPRLTDAGLATIEGLSHLKELDLQSTDLGDTGIKRIAKLRRLRSLELSDTKITDAGLENLKELSQLQELYLFSNRVTDEGVAKLQNALPNCTIFH
jgi:hypothetical protein